MQKEPPTAASPLELQQDVPAEVQQRTVIPAVTQSSLVSHVPDAPGTHAGPIGPVPQVWVVQTGACPKMTRQVCPAGQVMVTDGLLLWHVMVPQAPALTCQTLLVEQNAWTRPLPAQSS